MAVVKIEEVYLYTSEAAGNPAENIQAAAFMERCGVPYMSLMYNDASQHPQVFAALNSWWKDKGLPDVSTFPLVTYVEVHDDIPARYSPVKYLVGAEEIKKIVDIYNLRNP